MPHSNVSRFFVTLSFALAVTFTNHSQAQSCDPVELAQLLANDGNSLDSFGFSVSISGDTAIIGSRLAFIDNVQLGAAYIFTKINGTWIQQAKLVASDGLDGDQFGNSVSISGNTVIVGANFHDPSGAAYIFTESDGIWTQQAKLAPQNGNFAARFGESVSISNDVLIIGSYQDNENGTFAGAAYIYSRINNAWTQTTKLTPKDGSESDRFGWSVCIANDTAIIGATRSSSKKINAGAAYIYGYSKNHWIQKAKLHPNDGQPFDHFGRAVSLNQNTVVISSQNNHDAIENSGSVYIFNHTKNLWIQEEKLIPQTPLTGDEFGRSVAIDQGIVIVGALPINTDTSGTSSASAYAFERTNKTWAQSADFIPKNGTRQENIGISVAISDDTVFVGANDSSENGFWSGSAYIFKLNCNACPADLTNDGTLNFFDVSAFLIAFNTNDPIADFTNDGNFNFFDVSAFLLAFSAGCP